jgi:phosphatidylglycerol---prolipoprotein diacylglyceryl transferase
MAGTLGRMFDLTPDPIAFRIGPLPVHWYGIAYAVGLTAVYLLVSWLARRAGRNPELVNNGIIVVAIAALIGGRLYHVIDQWALYRDNLAAIVLPPYSGLGVYGGIATGTLAGWWYLTFRHREPFWTWADIVAPGLFLMQAIGRWGNFFNQELYGPPTSLPWGIPIDCAHRVAYACSAFPEATTRFHPLFLYESLSGFLGAAFLVFLFVRFRHRLRPGTLLLVFFIWYGAVRFGLEALRQNNWVLLGIPTAQLVSVAMIAIGVIGLVWRYRRRGQDDPAADPAAAPTEGGGARTIEHPDAMTTDAPPRT